MTALICLLFFLIPSIASATYNDPSLEPYLVYAEDGEECQDTTVRDTSPKDHTGVFSGGTAFATTPFGLCGTYHDGNTDYINTSATSDYDFTGTTPFSVFVWLNPDTVTQAQAVFLKNFTSESDETIGYAFQIGNPGQLAIIFKGGGASAFGGNNTISSGVWSRCGFTWDGTTVRLIRDKNQIASGTGSGPNTTGGDSLLRIGSRTHSTHQDYQGYMDGWRIYNKALSPEEWDMDYEQFFTEEYSDDEN